MKGRVPLVAVMGRPNVGKSTLVNRVASRAGAIVDSMAGVTRDRKYARARWRDRDFVIADTGGVGIEGGWLSEDIERHAFFAAEEADVVVLLVDVRTGVTGDDEWLAKKLKKLRHQVILAVNKTDSEKLEPEASVFYSLGLGEPVPISSKHGLGVGDLLDRIVELLPPGGEEEIEPEVDVAIVGRPNVGKSSILNKLAGSERVLVHEEPHTTRDMVDTVVESEGRAYRVLDTAGIRRKRTGMSDVEYYSSVRTLRAIDDADVVLLVVDADEGPTEHDQHIARRIETRGRACVVLVNKWDLIADTGRAPDILDEIAHRFRFVQHLPLLRVSALTGRGMDKILPLVDKVFDEWNRRVPTPELNEFIARVRTQKEPPMKGGRRLKMYYATQAKTAPPTVVIFVNDAGLVKDEYRRYLANQLREEYGFWGSPLRVHFRTAKGKGEPKGR